MEAQAGATVRSQMASIRRAAEEREAELRRALAAKEAAAEEALHRAKDRIAELEEEVTGLTSAVSRTEAEMDTLERRLRCAGSTPSRCENLSPWCYCRRDAQGGGTALIAGVLPGRRRSARRRSRRTCARRRRWWRSATCWRCASTRWRRSSTKTARSARRSTSTSRRARATVGASPSVVVMPGGGAVCKGLAHPAGADLRTGSVPGGARAGGGARPRGG